MDLTISRSEAQAKLLEFVEKASPDDLADFHRELFPRERTQREDLLGNPGTMSARIRARFAAGLLGEDVMDLWNAFLDGPRADWLDEKDDVIHLRERDSVGFFKE